MKTVCHVGQQKVQCAQAHDGEDVRGEHDKGIRGHSEDGRNAVDREDQVAGFDQHQHEEHWRCPEDAALTHEEALAMELRRDAQVAAQPAQQRVLLEVGLGVGEDDHLDARDDEEGAEDVENPGKLLYQPDSAENHAGAHDYGAEHTIEQHAALQIGRDREVAEDHDEHEHVVDRQRLLDQVAGEELQRLGVRDLGALGIVQVPPEQCCEREGEARPDSDPGGGLLDVDAMRLAAAEHEQVERQHREDENDEAGPDRPGGETHSGGLVHKIEPEKMLKHARNWGKVMMLARVMKHGSWHDGDEGRLDLALRQLRNHEAYPIIVLEIFVRFLCRCS
jgi:hypothetical protein